MVVDGDRSRVKRQEPLARSVGRDQFLCEHPLATQFMGIGHKQTHDRQSDVESDLLGIGHNLRKSPPPETALLLPPQVPYICSPA
nr:hypothetical protein Itr_chr01CG11710 [Ipomoea trifida]